MRGGGWTDHFLLPSSLSCVFFVHSVLHVPSWQNLIWITCPRLWFCVLSSFHPSTASWFSCSHSFVFCISLQIKVYDGLEKKCYHTTPHSFSITLTKKRKPCICHLNRSIHVRVTGRLEAPSALSGWAARCSLLTVWIECNSPIDGAVIVIKSVLNPFLSL